MTIAEACLKFSELFEAELLAELMLRYWQHPEAENREYRNALLSDAREALQKSIDGEVLLEGVRPTDMNLVAALWYVEWCYCSDPSGIPEMARRQEWLNKVEQSMPSCFCDPQDLV